jgi:hypothetical protein
MDEQQRHPDARSEASKGTRDFHSFFCWLSFLCLLVDLMRSRRAEDVKPHSTLNSAIEGKGNATRQTGRTCPSHSRSQGEGEGDS